MPTWTSFSAYARTLDGLRNDIGPRGRREITRLQAEEGARIARRAASGAVGGDMRHSGWGVALDVRVRRSGDDHILSPTRSSAGPWTEIEVGRHADGGVGRFQGPSVNMRTGNTSRRRNGMISVANRRRVGVRWNGMTRARGVASDAVAEMERRAPAIAERELKRILRGRVDVT